MALEEFSDVAYYDRDGNAVPRLGIGFAIMMAGGVGMVFWALVGSYFFG